jgi:hypothetical protein
VGNESVTLGGFKQDQQFFESLLRPHISCDITILFLATIFARIATGEQGVNIRFSWRGNVCEEESYRVGHFWTRLV